MKKLSRVVLVVSTTLAAALLAGAASPTAQSEPRTKRKPVVYPGHQNTPVVDDELMVSDPANPRILHSKRPGIIDRKWIERTAMPRLPAAAFEGVRTRPVPPGELVIRSPDAPAFAGAAFSPQVIGNVLVVDGADFTVTDQNGGLGFDHDRGAFGILNLALQNLGDNYDFVTVFSEFDDAQVAAYYFPLRQETDGLGKCDFQNGDTFGCLFNQLEGSGVENLQGFVFMNSLATWRDSDFNYDGFAHPFTDFESSLFSTLGQEVAHRWGSALRFIDPRSGSVSELLLGRDNSHWAAYADTDASVMDGWDWGEEKNGTFELLNDMAGYSTLDLYTMGAVPVASAKPFFVIDDAVFDVTGDQVGIDGRGIPADVVLQLPSVAFMDSFGMKVRATGESVPVTIQDVADAEGGRCPDPGATQKTFRQAVLFVTRPGRTPAQVAGVVNELNVALETWEAWWLDRTNRTLRLCTSLDGDVCTHAQMEIVGGELVHDGDRIEPGSEGTLNLTVKGSGGRAVEGAVFSLTGIGDSADFVEFPDTVDVGDIDDGDEATVAVKVKFAADYPAGVSAIIRATVSAANAADVTEEVRVFPGLRIIEEETFASVDHPWGVNVDEKDGTTSGREGALRYTENVELTCDMSKRSVERDASPGDRGAFVTGPGTDHVPNLLDGDAGDGAELDGDTSLWSPSFDLGGTSNPEFRFAYWFDGEEGDVLKVQLSKDGEKTFVTGKEVTESFHGWVVGRVAVRDVFNEVPAKVTMRFLFEGNGALEGGVDDVRLLDGGGGFCGCDASGQATPVAPLAFVFGLLALRRRRSAPSAGSGGSAGGIDGDTTPVL